MAEYKFIGKPARRVDALEKVLGTARYIADFQIEGVLKARCLRSPHPHALILNIDISAAKKVPGVKAVITSEDFVNHGRFGFPVEDMFMLAWKRVRYVGDAVAAVAANSEESLQAGLDAIIIEYEELPGVFDPEAALDPAAPIIGENPWNHPETPRGNLLTQYIVRKGEPDNMLAYCEVRLDEHYSTMHQEHAYIETEGALALPSSDGEGITVYATCQSPFINRGTLVTVLGMVEEDVRVIQPPVGGAFGGKDDLVYQTSGQVARLAMIAGKPVRMLFSREESMIASYKRDAMKMHIQLGANREGKLVAGNIHAVVDSGAYASITPFTAWRSSIHAMGPYLYDTCHVDVDVAYTNNAYSGAFRGFGNTEVCSAIEQAMDEMAEKLGIDPIDFRLKNCLRPGDFTPHGQKLGDDVALEECLQKVREISDWDLKRKSILSTNPASILKRGLGVAAVFHGVSLGAEGADFAVSTLSINSDNSLALTSGFTDYGNGSRTVYTLIAAEILGLHPDRILMLRPDTDTAKNSGPTVASRATILGGNATRIAAMRINDLLVQAAADLFGCQIFEVARHGEDFIGPNEEPVSYEKIVAHARKIGIMLSSTGRWESPENHWDFDKGQGKPYFCYHYGAQVAEVQVDIGTGKVDVLGIWAAHNPGKVIFPQGAYGQLYGGITQGLGYAIMERVDYDRGFIQATNFDEYLIPTALDVPEIVGAFVEKPLKDGPFGAKNLGEPGMVPAAPAILNAIYNACGRRVRHLPANLEKVLLGHDLRKEGSNMACKLGLHLE
ncbi:MAG: xanthine dehydrogenase family protein molybdopterin-binding subunit [Anaerolineaceae bacterium]